MQAFYQKNKQPIQNFLILSFGILACFLFFRYLFPIFLPFAFGWLLSLIFRPLADGLEKAHVPRWAGALLGILLLLTALGLLGYFVGSKLTEQLRNLVQAAPYYLESLMVSLVALGDKIDALLVDLPSIFTDIFSHLRQEFSNILISLVPTGGSASAITAVPKFLLGFLISLFSAYFFTKDEEKVKQAYHAHVEPLFGLSIEGTKKELTASLWGYVKTQLILMLFTFSLCWIGLEILNSPYALLLSVIIAIIDALPFFGSGFILWPGAVMQFLWGNTTLAIGYLVVYALVQILRQLMQPKILGMQIGMHPLLTLFSMYFGYKCIGFFGLILGPIVAVVLRTLLRICRQAKERESTASTTE